MKPAPLTAPDHLDHHHARPAPGYWLLGADGGIFTFGNAKFFGSTGAMRLNQPVVGMASAARQQRATGSSRPTAAIFSFGERQVLRLDRRRCTSTSRSSAWPRRARARATGSSPRDGGIFTFGDAKFYGSTGGAPPRPADRRHGAHAVGQGLLAGRGRRRHLHVRRRRVLRIGGGPRASASSSAWRRRPTAAATGCSNSVGQVFTFGDAPYFGDVFRRGIGDRDRASRRPRRCSARRHVSGRSSTARRRVHARTRAFAERATRARSTADRPRRAITGSAGRRGGAA